jgi:indolepyruvate ferredoxin oxidoreductase alpha subunit
LAPNPDPLKDHPIATVLDTCVGCGLCGANVLADGLCPSFYETETVVNPGAGERFMANVRGRVIDMLEGGWA